MANTRQKSSWDLIKDDTIRNMPLKEYGVSVPFYNQKTGQVDFKLQNIGYKKVLDNVYIIKMGFSGTPNMLPYPILIKTNGTKGDFDTFYIAQHSGCYEWQREDVDSVELDDVKTDVVASSVWVPYCILESDGTQKIIDCEWVLDYVNEDY